MTTIQIKSCIFEFHSQLVTELILHNFKIRAKKTLVKAGLLFSNFRKLLVQFMEINYAASADDLMGDYLLVSTRRSRKSDD